MNRRIIQPVHDELNQLALGFLGKKENKNDPCSLDQFRIFRPTFIQRLLASFLKVSTPFQR
jgi:hypothetical protein